MSVARRPKKTTFGDCATPAMAGYTASRNAHPPMRNAVAARALADRDARCVRIAGTTPTAHQATPEPRETMRRASNVGGMGSRGPQSKASTQGQNDFGDLCRNRGPPNFQSPPTRSNPDAHGSGSDVDPSGRCARRRRHLPRSLAFLVRPLLRPEVDALRY